MEGENMKKAAVKALFVVYGAFLIKMILIKHFPMELILEELAQRGWQDMATAAQNGNWMPFQTILPYVKSWGFLFAARRNLIGNVVLFMPLGVLVPFSTKRDISIRGTMAAGFVASLSLEVAQLATGLGVFDVDDLILNTLGAALGWLLYRAGRFLQEAKNEVRKANSNRA